MQKENVLPERLRTGDVIGIVSPSAPVEAEQEEMYAAGVAWLKGLGLVVQEGRFIRSSPTGGAPTGRQKAEDINAMFADPTVKAIICSQGGDSAQECLPWLDWDCIRRNPKIITGISDITVLLNAIHQQTGLVTFHGNDVVWGLGRKPGNYDRREFKARFMDGVIGSIPANGPRYAMREGRAEGKLLGGNLRCLLKLADTPYFPDMDGAILLLEALRIDPIESRSYLQQLRTLGAFERISGAIVGYIYGEQKHGGKTGWLESALAQESEGHPFPILKVNDFGHNWPNTVFPVGTMARLDTGELTIELLEECVK